ncbi:rodlin [Streptomyces sp. NRRL S-378]|uniref:rodlin n=1 Tax=Streptomyces sp. NRRL S-378 TaxID=1463904 RepID=UPI0004C89039|nr:rodlin [Streptomyces sp. NRRL S-378]
MLKKIMATAAATASLVGAGAAVAAPAMAIGNDNGVNTVNGNGAQQIYGNQKTHGDQSPQLGLVQGTLNKPCIINVLSNPQNQQCTENSTQAKGDEPLSHILDNIPVLSGNVSAGS